MTDTATVQSLTLQPDTNAFARVLGEKQYELTNHLPSGMAFGPAKRIPPGEGNVLATISDQKKAINSSGTVAYWEPKVVSYTDYMPFGMQMVGRSGNTSEPGFGFNGQEKDDEIYGSGNSMNAEFWQYDARLGRRWNVDPVVKHWESPYVTLGNNPILYIDLNGDSIEVNFIDSKSQESFNAFFGTKEGKEFISKYAAKGQTINGYTFKKNGEYHDKGIDLKYSDIDMGPGKENVGAVTDGGQHGGNIKDGRLKLEVKLNTGSSRDGFLEKVTTITHESLLHVTEYSFDFVDNSIIDFSHDPFYRRLDGHTPTKRHHLMFHYKSESSKTHPLAIDGLNLLEEVNDEFNLGNTRNDLWEKIWSFWD